MAHQEAHHNSELIHNLPIKHPYITNIVIIMIQDYDDGVVEEEDTDYVDIPIKVVTQSNVAVS